MNIRYANISFLNFCDFQRPLLEMFYDISVVSLLLSWLCASKCF